MCIFLPEEGKSLARRLKPSAGARSCPCRGPYLLVNIKTALCLYFLLVKCVSIFHCSLWTWITGNLSSHINTDGISSYHTAALTSVSDPNQGSTYISLGIYISNIHTKRLSYRRPLNLSRCAKSSTNNKKFTNI